MHAMQYEITLPADYDMGIIRKRVEAKGHLTDAFPGLGVKAYLMRERGTDGSTVNQYAPFYLWRTSEGMNSFLWGPGFQGLCADFGRPVVQHWPGVSYEEGPSAAQSPAVAVRRRVPMTEYRELPEYLAAAQREADRIAALPSTVLSAMAFDPRLWEVVHFTLLTEDRDNLSGERFQVLHTSAPERDRLPHRSHA
ncbi:DUF4865 family protein [Streptomyces sp. NBC_01304]|uniref:DUF4865 family protein n=1 Tax=Streptomyces sp. NBC_01304 TaxID=2903818 RepID=UPI002E0F8283|nr:DUF4865 family protein [Streptomyces sp. NBC_01304]